MVQLLRRLQYLFNRSRLDRELAGDMEFHREMAAREGRSNFGNVLLLREQSRDVWGWTWIDRLLQDLRYAARGLGRSPGFTLIAVLMIAIGTGANIAAFGFFDLLVLRPLNVRDPDSLLRFQRRSPLHYAYAVPYPEMAFLREHSRTLSAVLAMKATRISIPGEEKQPEVHFVTTNYFSELGAIPLLGQTISPAAESASTQPIVVLSEGFWRRHFGADFGIVGKTVHLNGKPAVILGVVPRSFSGLQMSVPAMWAPIALQPHFVNGSRLFTDYSVDSGVQMFGRLRPGLAPKMAEDEMASLAARLRKEHPEEIWDQERLRSQPGGYATGLVGGDRYGSGSEGRSEIYTIFGLIGALVLLILAVTCANLGSLLLARGVTRRREMSIRIALGAGSARLLRQLLTESVLLSVLGSAAGLFVGNLVLQQLMVISGAPAWLDPSPDWRVVLFTIGIAFMAAALFGLAPAMQTAQRHYRAGARQFLVGAQIAASCVLVILAALLGRALNHATSAGPGFDYQHVVSINPNLAQYGYTPARARSYLDTLQTRLRAIPGVASVSMTLSPPLGHRTITTGITVDDRSFAVELHYVDPEFFHTIQLPVTRGRNFRHGESGVLLVSESLAQRAWPGRNPVGRTVQLNGDRIVTGIVRSARLTRFQESDSVEVYLPMDTANLPSAAVLVRTSRPPEDIVGAVAAAARSVAGDIVPETQLLTSAFQRKIEGARYTAISVSALGMIANLLACFGILGVVAFTVSQRTKEIGIRMALGAGRSHLISTVLRQLVLPVTIGLLLGLGGAIALSRLLRQMLFGISSLDPASYGLAIGIFLATVLAAAAPPTRKALRIQPLLALRHD